MRDGMARIKQELGPNAVIVQSRKVRRKGIMGFFAPPQIEITAAVETPERLQSGLPRNNSFQGKIERELSELRTLINRLLARDSMSAEEKKRERRELEIWRSRLDEQEIYSELITQYLEEIKGSLSDE